MTEFEAEPRGVAQGYPDPSPLQSRAVLVVDDQPDFLRLARELLRQMGTRDIAEATSGEEALALLPAVAPDVVLLDIEMPGLNGFETARRMLAIAPRLTIVLVSNTDEPQYGDLARAVGAQAFLTKRDFSTRALTQLLEP
jgi:two-component system invasion response regulator UvrY